MCILKHSGPWIVFNYEVICSGAASAHLCSHFIRIHSGPTNKLCYLIVRQGRGCGCGSGWATYWDSGRLCHEKLYICCRSYTGRLFPTSGWSAIGYCCFSCIVCCVPCSFIIMSYCVCSRGGGGGGLVLFFIWWFEGSLLLLGFLRITSLYGVIPLI